MSPKLRIRLKRSVIGVLPKQRATIRSLGLRKIGSTIEQENNLIIQGMIRVVYPHLVDVEEI
jgi:large subunit ribosomal protein L30